jgi:iron complex outermembrane receptor protein
LIQIANGGQARIKGLESELSWAAGHGLTFSTARVDLRDQDNALLGGNVPAYGTANFTAGIEQSNYSLEFFVTNAFNRLALANCYTECVIEVCAFPGVRPGVGGLIYDTPIQPRVIGIQFGQKL